MTIATNFGEQVAGHKIEAEEVLRQAYGLYLYDRGTRPVPWERVLNTFAHILSTAVEGFDAEAFKEELKDIRYPS